MSDASKAVFLSYASQDAEAAKRICDALRAAGVEIWFDAEGGLEHGDEWDAKIRRQIKECVLFIPIISANTEAREEGYFRIEWDLAAERARGIATGVAFILPVLIDDTREPDALVPDRFRAVQWTKLPGGWVPPEVLQRFLKLWSHRTGAAKQAGGERGVRPVAPPAIPAAPAKRAGSGWIIGTVAALLIAGALGLLYLQRDRPVPPAAPTSAAPVRPPESEADRLVVRAYGLCTELNYTRDNLAAAEDLSRRAAELDSDSAAAWAARAYVQSCYVVRGWDTSEKRRDDTQTFARRALALDPNETSATLALAYVLNAQRGFAQAEAMLRRAIAVRPDDYRLHTTLIGAVAGQGRSEEAVALAEEAVRRFPREPLVHYGLANGYRSRGLFDEALASYDAAAALQPFAGAFLYRAILLVTWRGDVTGARAALEQVAPADRVEDRPVGVAMWLGLIERNPARVYEAAAATTRVYFEDPVTSGPKAWSVALAYQLEGKEILARQQWQAAEEVLRRHLREHPDSTDDQARLATTLARLGQLDEAAREIAPFEAGAHEQPSARASYLLAQYYAARGDAARAAPFLEQAMNRHIFVSVHALKLDPQWDRIRDQPKFEALLVKPDRSAVATARPQTPDPRPTSPPPADSKSVAVLAFANLSDDKANEYFSDGISEELLNVLAKVPGLKVSARTSAFYFKGKDVPIPEIAQKLGVAYVVEGSVRKQGDKVRITAQLIKAADGFHVWSDTFTRDLKDIFAVQDEIAGLIAQNLSLKLGNVVQPSAPLDPRVFELYVQARQAWSLRNDDAFARAEQLLVRALELDPGFLRGRAALIDVRQMRAFRDRTIGYFEQRHDPALERFENEARQVLALDPDLAEAYATLGTTLQGKWDFPGALGAYRQAVSLNPNYATGHHWLAMELAMEGRMDEALVELKLASELDPMSSIILDNYGWTLNHAGRYREALEKLDRAQALNPTFSQTRAMKAATLAALGRTNEAVTLAREINYFEIDEQTRTYVAVGLVKELEGVLAAAESREAVQRFKPLLASGRTDEALASMQSGVGRIAFGECMELLYLPLYDPVRRDPRFRQIMATLGLAEAHDRAQAWRRANPPEKPEAGERRAGDSGQATAKPQEAKP